LRTKEKGKHLTLNEYDDDDDDLTGKKQFYLHKQHQIM